MLLGFIMGASSSTNIDAASKIEGNVENEVELIKATTYELFAIIISNSNKAVGEHVLEYKSQSNLPEFTKYAKLVSENVDLLNLNKVFGNTFGYESLVENAKVRLKKKEQKILCLNYKNFKNNLFIMLLLNYESYVKN